MEVGKLILLERKLEVVGETRTDSPTQIMNVEVNIPLYILVAELKAKTE
jgi:hypothetical protein